MMGDVGVCGVLVGSVCVRGVSVEFMVWLLLLLLCGDSSFVLLS